MFIESSPSAPPGSFLAPPMFGTTNHLEDEVRPARVLQLENNHLAPVSTFYNTINEKLTISDTHERLLNEPDVIRLMEPGTIYSIAFHKKRDS